MIGPSRRRRSRTPRDPLALHLRISRERRRSRRLLVASGAALALSILAWVAGAGLTIHAAVTAAAFAAALFVPSVDAARWALAWIAGRIGYSYQTAMETRDGDDPFGLHAAVAERALVRARNLDPPRATAWWLPVLAVAVALLLLPASGLPGFAGGRPGAPPPVTGPDSEQALDPPQPPPLESLAPLDDPNSTQRAEDPGGEGNAGTDPADDVGASGDGAGQDEGQVLDRFLDNLREREDVADDPPGRQGNAPPNLKASPQPGEQPPGEGEQQDGQGNEAGEPQPGGQGEPGEADQPQLGSEAEQQGDQPGQEDGAEQGGGAQQGDNEIPGGFDPGEQPSGGNPAEGGNNPERPSDDQGLGAGDLPSDEQQGGPLEGEPDGDPQFLEGRLGSGPENAGGLIRLPGRDEFDLPIAIEPQSYLRAAEEAVTEGDIPVEYQEVIRNYFR